MINYLFRVLLSLNSVMVFGAIYMIKAGVWIENDAFLSAVIYVLIPILIAAVCIQLSEKLPKDSIEGGIKDIELANDTFMPSYLGYFFVALSVPDDGVTIYVVVGLLIVFLFCSQNLYYNPLFLAFGYKFYYVISGDGMKKFIITRESINGTDGLKFENLRRINYFTYIDKGVGHGSSDCEG